MMASPACLRRAVCADGSRSQKATQIAKLKWLAVGCCGKLGALMIKLDGRTRRSLYGEHFKLKSGGEGQMKDGGSSGVGQNP